MGSNCSLPGIAETAAMKPLDEIAQIEYMYRGFDGKPTLGEASDLLLERWREGARDIETGLRLMFLAWYAVVEPTELTGLPDDGSAAGVFQEVFDYFGGESTEEPEILASVALMASVAAWGLGDCEAWEEIGERLAKRAPRLGFDLPPEQFADRGAYGDYFEHQARGHRE